LTSAARLILTLAILLACARVYAQTYEVSIQAVVPRFRGELGSLVTGDERDNDTRLIGRNGFGARLTVNTRGYYGHEFSYFDMRAIFSTQVIPQGATVRVLKEDKVKVRLGAYNFLLYMMPRGERWRPYLTGGLQAHEYGAPNITEFTTGRSRNYGANYGAGIKVRLFPNVLLRADFRHYFGGRPYDLTFEDQTRFGGIYKSLEGSAGIVIGFR